MTECLRPHHAEMLNAVALLTEPQLDPIIEEKLSETPLTEEGIHHLRQLEKDFSTWSDIEFELIDGPDDWCHSCKGLNRQNNQCEHGYPWDDPALSAEENRRRIDREVLTRYPELIKAKTLQEAHRIVIHR